MILIIRKVSVTNFFTLVKFSEQILSPLSHFLKDLLKKYITSMSIKNNNNYI